MAGELVRWLASTPAERERDLKIERVYVDTDEGMARVAGIARVSEAAMLGTLNVAMMKREASLLVPEDAAKFDLVATQAAIGMASEINRMAGRH
jgi:hypothetical protein